MWSFFFLKKGRGASFWPAPQFFNILRSGLVARLGLLSPAHYAVYRSLGGGDEVFSLTFGVDDVHTTLDHRIVVDVADSQLRLTGNSLSVVAVVVNGLEVQRYYVAYGKSVLHFVSPIELDRVAVVAG